MATRFRKSVKIAPGVRLNVNKGSVGISAGVKGARVSANSNGRVTRSVGIPGTGLYDVKTVKSGKTSSNQQIPSGDTVGSTAALPREKKTHFVLFLVLAVIFVLSGFYGLADANYSGGVLCLLLGGVFGFLAFRAKKKNKATS